MTNVCENHAQFPASGSAGSPCSVPAAPLLSPLPAQLRLLHVAAPAPCGLAAAPAGDRAPEKSGGKAGGKMSLAAPLQPAPPAWPHLPHFPPHLHQPDHTSAQPASPTPTPAHAAPQVASTKKKKHNTKYIPPNPHISLFSIATPGVWNMGGTKPHATTTAAHAGWAERGRQMWHG